MVARTSFGNEAIDASALCVQDIVFILLSEDADTSSVMIGCVTGALNPYGF